VMRWFKRAYEPLLKWSLAHRLWLVVTTVVVLAASGWLFQRLGAEFVPQMVDGFQIRCLLQRRRKKKEDQTSRRIHSDTIVLGLVKA
jgi:Cu/Ag efflux pump CusA